MSNRPQPNGITAGTLMRVATAKTAQASISDHQIPRNGMSRRSTVLRRELRRYRYPGRFHLPQEAPVIIEEVGGDQGANHVQNGGGIVVEVELIRVLASLRKRAPSYTHMGFPDPRTLVQ